VPSTLAIKIGTGTVPLPPQSSTLLRTAIAHQNGGRSAAILFTASLFHTPLRTHPALRASSLRAPTHP